MNSHPITAQILTQVKSIDINLPEALDDKWAEIEQAEVELALHAAKLGLRYMDLREAIGHGGFMEELKQRGIAQRTVNRYMDVAKFFKGSPESNLPTLANLKPTQIDALASLPEQEKQALTPEKITEYGQMSVRTLRAEVKQLRLNVDEQQSKTAENTRLKQRNEQLEQERVQAINLLNQEQLKKAPETLYGVPVEVANTRQQAIKIAELLSTLTCELNHLVQGCTNSLLDSAIARECAFAINTSTSGQIMQLVNTFAVLQSSFGAEVLNSPDNLPLYTADEVENALRNAEVPKGEFLARMGK